MGALDGMQIGERRTLVRKGRKITFERVPAFGKGKRLHHKIISNKKA